ncbi:MAG TPA: hypothetical protein DGG95_15625 [Cytophagales bacterium]|jgi:SAM-dependent methyltransferase|nr:hypothetical protein [Cytophagales bacterium]
MIKTLLFSISCLATIHVVAQSAPASYYGLFESKELAMTYYERFGKDFEIKNGETVADIGSDNGWLEGVYSLVPNLKCKFYLEEIDTTCLNKKIFTQMVSHYTKLNGGSIDDDFFYSIGDERSTHLPKNTFDRVILALTYHELSYKEEMLNDIKSILKPTGVLMISENVTLKHRKRRRDCKHYMPIEKDLIAELNKNGFELKKKTINAYQKRLVLYQFALKSK